MLQHIKQTKILQAAIVGAIVCAAIAGSLWSQQAKPAAESPQEEPGARFSSDTRLVVLHTTVVDKSGHFVTDLTKSAFSVFENGVPQPIRDFRHEDIPVSLGLIIDNSGSMRDKRAKVEAAGLALVKDSNKDDEVFIVNFNDEAFLDNPHNKDFTNDIKELQEALTRIDSRGGTAMRDAIRMSIDHLKEKGKKEKKVLVVVTDGNDNSEEHTSELQSHSFISYAVFCLKTKSHDPSNGTHPNPGTSKNGRQPRRGPCLSVFFLPAGRGRCTHNLSPRRPLRR